MTTTISTSRRSSSSDRPALRVPAGDGDFVVRCSTAADGDFHLTGVAPDELEARRRAFVDLPWTMLDQVHGTGVVDVTEPGGSDRAVADVAVTVVADAVLGTWVGDCAPVIALGTERALGAAHAGWRGLAAGVLHAMLAAMPEPMTTIVLGPVIGPCCYEFGDRDLRAVASGLGLTPGDVAGRTSDGALALDVPAAVGAFAAARSLPVVRLGGCTGCGYPGFSHRVRRDPERHVVAAWRTGGGRT